MLVLLNSRQWGYVLGNDARGELLEVSRTGSVDAVWEFLSGLGCPRVGHGRGSVMVIDQGEGV